jgi:hypothetical protein
MNRKVSPLYCFFGTVQFQRAIIGSWRSHINGTVHFCIERLLFSRTLIVGCSLLLCAMHVCSGLNCISCFSCVWGYVAYDSLGLLLPLFVRFVVMWLVLCVEMSAMMKQFSLLLRSRMATITSIHPFILSTCVGVGAMCFLWCSVAFAVLVVVM